MKRVFAACLSVVLVCVLIIGLVGCGWKTLTSAGIDLESVEFDDKGYIEKEEVKEAVLASETLAEAECISLSMALDESRSPAVYVMDFSSAANSYHFEVDAKTGELVDKLVYSL